MTGGSRRGHSESPRDISCHFPYYCIIILTDPSPYPSPKPSPKQAPKPGPNPAPKPAPLSAFPGSLPAPRRCLRFPVRGRRPVHLRPSSP